MVPTASGRCLPFLVASADHQGTLRFKICEVDSMVASERQKERVGRLLAADLAIADDGSFVETTDGLSANDLKNLYNSLAKLDPTGKRIVYSVSNVTNPLGTPVYRVSYMLFSSVPSQAPPSGPAPAKTPHTEAEPMVHDDSEQDAPHHRGIRGSLVNLFTSPTKLRSKKRRSRHSHDDYAGLESPARDSAVSLMTSTSSRSISDFRNLINASPNSAHAPSGNSTPPRPTSGQISVSSGLLTPQYVPGARVSTASLAPPPPPSSFPAHLNKTASSFRASTTSLVQSPFENSLMVSSVHPLYSAPDELYHKVRRPSPREYRSTVPRPSNGSLRTTASVDSSGSTIRDGGYGERTKTPTPFTSFKRMEVTTVMPRFDSLRPMFDRQQSPVHLVGGPTETTWVGLYIPSDHQFGSPNDDPRFVMYGKSLTELIPFKGKYTPDMSRLAFTTSRYADGRKRDRDSVSTAGENVTNSSSSGTAPSSDTLDTELTTPFTNFDKPAILAATIERWVAQLTSQLDYEELLKFFYTYRSYISPFDLLHILIYRFQWTLMPSSDDAVAPEGVEVEPELTHWKEDGAIKRIVRARTCVVLRYWLSTFFVVDFLRNRRLGIMMTNWLNMISRSKLLDSLPDAKAMLGLVKDLVRQSKIIYYEDGRACTPPEDRKVGEWDGNSVRLSPELLDMSPVLEMLLADDDPSRTDPRNPDVDLDFTLPLPKADIAHLKPSDDGFHEPDGDNPPPPPLTPYQRAYLRAGVGAPTIPGQIISSIIPHAGRLTIQQANALAPLHIADPVTLNPNATSAERGTSYVSKHHSKMERAVVNTLGRLSQWKHMLNPRSPFTSQPLKIIGQMPRGGSVFKRNAAISGGTLVSGSFPKLPNGSYTPYQRSPLSIDRGEEATNEEAPAENEMKNIPVIDVHAPVLDEEEAEAMAPAQGANDRPLPLMPSVSEGENREHADENERREVADRPLPALPTNTEKLLPAAPMSFDAGPVDVDHDADAESDEEDVGQIHRAVRALRHPPPFERAAPISAIDHNRLDLRDSAASWASSISSFGQLLPRRSLSEVVKPSSIPAPRAPPGLPPGLEGFIEQENYSSSESDPEDDVKGTSKERPVPAKSAVKSNSHISLRREYLLAEQDANQKAAAAAVRLARRAGLSSSSEIAADETDDDSPLLAPDEKPRAWHFAPIHKDDDDDVEGGDAETALRRLEGAVDPEIAKMKAEKLQAMVKRAKERTKAIEAGADYSNEDRLADEAFLAWVAEEDAKEEPKDVPAAPSEVTPTPTENTADFADPAGPIDPTGPVNPSDAAAILPPNHVEPATEETADPVSSSVAAEVVVSPPGSVESDAGVDTKSPFTPEFPIPSGTHAGLDRFPPPGPRSGWLPSYDVPGPHDAPHLIHTRSWIMDYRSDALARHFSIIDRDLLTNLQFDQIVSLEWARPVPEITVYDWEWFIKWDAERKSALKEAPYRNLPTISSVSACRARFNLMLMWTATEIVLTPARDRPSLADKFIRLASKLHHQNNFASLVAIMLGLQSQPVARAMRRSWHRIGAWELRMLKDLIAFTAPAGNYRNIRETIAHLTARRWMAPSAAVKTTDRDGQTVLENAKPSCIPFIHAYLGELNDYSLLPDFIDPTSCEKPYSYGTDLNDPGKFAPLPPLPLEVPLRPLVNVGKQRLIADIVRDVVAGQQLAHNYTLADLDGKVFIKCMTLRALAPEQLDELTARM